MEREGQQFGSFRFDAGTLLLFRDGEPLPIGRRGALILKALLAKPGSVVSKDRLLDIAWPGVTVEESNLSVQIAALRRLIGAQWIRTVERVGYRFVGLDSSAARDKREPADAFPLLALPAFEDGGDAALDRVGRALRADLIVALARFRSLHLVAADRDDRHADYRLALSLHARGEAASRAVLNLCDALSGRILWAQGFEIGETVATAEAMAAAIESAVQAAEFLGGPRGNAPGGEAYGHYLAGRWVLNSSLAADNATAFTRFMAALALEPDNATYLAAASEAMHHRLAVGWEPLRPDDKQIGRGLAHRTLALAGDDAVAIALVGNTLFTVDEEDLGLALCRRALEMNPTSQLVLACALHAEHWGGSLEAQAHIAFRATTLSPNDPGQRFALGGMATAARLRGEYGEALGWARRSLSFGPGYSPAHWSVVAALVELGRQEEAERHLGRYRAIAPGVSIRSLQMGQHFADLTRHRPTLDSLRRAGMPER